MADQIMRCGCGCHKMPRVLHVVPCCEGRCPHCGAHFRCGLKSHESECEKNPVNFEDVVVRMYDWVDPNGNVHRIPFGAGLMPWQEDEGISPDIPASESEDSA